MKPAKHLQKLTNLLVKAQAEIAVMMEEGHSDQDCTDMWGLAMERATIELEKKLSSASKNPPAQT